MRIVTHTKLAKRNRRLTTYLFLGTMALLVGGFLFVNVSLFTEETPSPLIVLLQALILPVAFFLTLTSVRLTNNWARQPYPEDAIAGGLKGISKKSILYNYHHFPARHVLITPQGIFAIVTRWHNGRFTVEGDRWKSHKGGISRFFSMLRMDGVGDPMRDAQRAAEHVQKLLPDGSEDMQVQPLIVFTDPKADLEIIEPTVPVLYADDKQSPNLTEYLREQSRLQKEAGKKPGVLPLSDEQIEAFEEKTVR